MKKLTSLISVLSLASLPVFAQDVGVMTEIRIGEVVPLTGPS